MIVGPVSNARSRDLSFHLCLYFLCFHCDYEIQSTGMNQRTRNSCLLHRENPCVRKLYRPSLYTNIYLFLALVYRNTRKMAALLHSKQRLPTRTLTLSWKRSEKVTFTVFFGFERPHTTSRQTIRVEISRKMHK